MSTKAQHHLDDKTLSTVQDLIQINVDSAKGLNDAAAAVVDMSVANTFKELSGERKHQAEELRSVIQQSGQKPQEGGSLAGAAHRAWLDLRSALGGGVAAVLEEAERGEDRIKEEYAQAVSKLSETPAAGLVKRHAAAVKQGHDRIRALRDAHKR